MKRFILSIFLFGCFIHPALASTNEPMLVGGYAAADAADARVEQAAHAAVAKKSSKAHPLKFVKVLSAKSQIVAGVNYDLNIEVKSANKTRYAQVVVFQNLNDTMELTKWRWLSQQVGQQLKASPR